MFRKHGKPLLVLFLILYAAFLLMPAGIYGLYLTQPGGNLPAGDATQDTPAPSPSPSGKTAPAAAEVAPEFLEGITLPGRSPAPSSEPFTVYDTATGQTLSLTPLEFLPAALACEMDLSAPAEALKAQAVALYTFYTYKKEQNSGDGADFACDTANWLVYVPTSAMEERWGEDFSAYYEILAQAVSDVEGQVLTWEGRPACTSFFSISAGSTESSWNVWGEEFPYLTSVASPGDCFANGYRSTAALTGQQLSEAAQAAWGGETDFSGPEETWVEEIQYSSAGYVISAVVGGRSCTGEELREAFGLRSAHFSLRYTEGTFHFTVEGWGHGVGMSQAGAVFLANQGASYQEILAHYYPGTALENGA